MFSFLGGESPALQLYGKVPVAKDYVRLGCGDGSGRELREWLDRAFGAAREASDQRVLGEPLRFVGQGTDDPLQGVIWPSSDAGGKRLFPLSLFVSRKKKALTSDLAGSLAQAEGIWRQLAELREACLSAPDGQALLKRHRGHDLDVADAGQASSVAAELEAWVDALWPDAGRDGLADAFARIGALVSDGHRGPFRLPLVRDLPLRDQVLGWVGVLRSLGALSDEIPTLFFPNRSVVSSGGLAPLVACARPLTDAEVEWLLPKSDEIQLGRADLFGALDEDAADLIDPPESETPLFEALAKALDSFGKTAGGP